MPNLDKLLEQLVNPKDRDNLGSKIDKQKMFSEKGSSFVYNALKVKLFLNKEAAILTLNYISNTNLENKQKIFDNIVECFGEDIIPNIINRTRESIT